MQTKVGVEKEPAGGTILTYLSQRKRYIAGLSLTVQIGVCMHSFAAHLQAQGIAPLPPRESHFRSAGPAEVIEIDLNSDDEDPATGGRSGPRKRARIASQDDAPDVKPVKLTRSDEEEDVSVLRVSIT